MVKDVGLTMLAVMTETSSDGTSHRLLAAWIGLLLGGVLAAVICAAFAIFAGSSPSVTVIAAVGAVLGAVLGWMFPRPIRVIGSAIFSLLP